MIPVVCMGCSHRFTRTAAAVLADPYCPRCASSDIDADDTRIDAAPRPNPMVAAKIAAMAATARHYNPHLSPLEALDLARAAVASYGAA